jgi:hypothetical protein
MDGKHRDEFNDTKLIQTSNLAVTPQPMTATLIFGVNLSDPARSAYSKLYSGQAATRKISSAA